VSETSENPDFWKNGQKWIKIYWKNGQNGFKIYCKNGQSVVFYS